MIKGMRNNDFKKEQMECMGYRVLVELEPLEDEYHGSIHIVKENERQEKIAMNLGTVLSIGALAYNPHGGPEKWASGGLKVGDRVWINSYSGVYIDPFEEDPDNHSGYTLLEDERVCIRINPLKKEK